ncbi:MAG: PstS family phosphate ABC transporter substrate-binding protein [Deltaproteobacteria bacterium]|nr:PstS family phosphate ABC transporter substrate-binding protein [Deltaproteobacteria bacterium]
MKKILPVICMMWLLVGCTKSATQNNQADIVSPQQETGTIKIDGSSTVYPLTEAVAEEYRTKQPNVRVTVGVSGTGGGMKKFIAKEIDISGASRPIKDSEAKEATVNQVTYTELKVAFDGLSVVVNPKNTFATTLTLDELKKIWMAGSTVKTWKDVRDTFPDKEIVLYGPGTDSGTFDYFTETVLGKVGAIRPDFTASENDHVLVQGVAGDEYALGFFGYAYYLENQSKLKLVAIDSGNGPVAPSVETIKDGTYSPLSRPIFIYASNESLKTATVKDFVKFYLAHSTELANEVGYVGLDEVTLQQQVAKLQ